MGLRYKHFNFLPGKKIGGDVSHPPLASVHDGLGLGLVFSSTI